MRLVAGDLIAGDKLKQAQGYHRSLSKVVELNNKYHLFFRRIKNENGQNSIPIAAVAGRSLEFKVFNTTFLVQGEDQIEITETGKLVDVSGMNSWGRIARVIHSASAIRDKKNKEAEAKRTSDDLGLPIDQVALAKELEKIELEYNGGKAADGTNIAPSISPLISGIQIKVCAQCLVVRVNTDGSPDWDKAEVAAIELSNKRKNELLAILSDPNYCIDGDDYIEVQYNYMGADKKAAGQGASFQGIAKSVSFSTQYEQSWNEKGKNLVMNLTTDPENIAAKNQNVNGTKTPADIIASFKKYCATNVGIIASIPMDADDTKANAKAIVESGIVDVAPKIKDSLEQLIAGQEDAGGAVVPESVKEDEKHEEEVLKTATDLAENATKDLQNAATVAPDFDALNLDAIEGLD